MFKLLSLALISLVGMNYANDCGNNIRPKNSNIQLNANINTGFTIYNGSDGRNLDTGFYDVDYDFTLWDSVNDIYAYNYAWNITLKADYIFVYNSETTFEFNDFQGYFIVQNNNNGFRIRFGDVNVVYYNYSGGIDEYDQLVGEGRFAIYIVNPVVIKYGAALFQGGGNSYIVNTANQTSSYLVPLVKTQRYSWIDKDFVFGEHPFGLGYFNYDNSAYYALGYAVQSQATQADNVSIFKGLFKSFDSLYDGYDIQYMQNINGNQYFGPLGVSSLSDCIHLTNSDYFYPFAGRYHNIGYDDSHGYDYVWYTLYTQIGTSGTVNTAISNVRSFVHNNFSSLHIYYQNMNFTNQTRVYAKTYYDLLTYNPNYNVLPGGGSTGNGLQGAFDLLGTAFNKLWQVGNIAVLGSITLNTLILLPLVISLMLFVIHLIKKG